MDAQQRIVIRNFGPLSNVELKIRKIAVLTGENATGKSAIIKLIATFLWIEKALFRGTDKKWFEKENRLKSTFLPYHRIENFLRENTEMEYYGKAYTIKYAENRISIENKPDGDYRLPQIMYVPSERNFLTYLRTTGNLKSEGALQDFEREYFNAANQLNGSLPLPINGFEIEYSKLHEMLYVKNGNCKIRITEAASGLQSSIPLFLVSDYLSKFNKKPFVNIVEKPEQNLFPVSQMKMIKSLVSICNRNEDGNLIVSTHSPYILATINNLIMAEKAGAKEPEKVVSRVAKDLWINHNDVFACLVENGTVTEIIDEEFDLIQQEQLDSVSRIINGEFDFLYEL